jgi:hypothetical protein
MGGGGDFRDALAFAELGEPAEEPDDALLPDQVVDHRLDHDAPAEPVREVLRTPVRLCQALRSHPPRHPQARWHL